jgi:bacillithiol biosynthesis cysteine-adding enzyme BshC
LETVCLPHSKTHFFSNINIDYLAGDKKLDDFYNFKPNDEGLKAAIDARKSYPINRAVLVEALQKQYNGFTLHESVSNNMELLKEQHTFTICTAHQPNLMTGYLYFIYKILHAVKLARHLKSIQPECNFVPVFYIGSEDNDLDELGTFRYNDVKYRWNTEQKGAVGRMNTKDLQTLLQQLINLLGPPGDNTERLKEIIAKAYAPNNTIATATRHLVNELLGSYGVVVIDSDDVALKQLFIPVLKQELFQPVSDEIVHQQTARLNKSYAGQAFSRPINLFYLKDNIRERIEKTATGWQVLHTDVHFDKAALEQEVEQHPERFSPNVILRGVFQESILPDVAFIGGGSEVAYWLQLKGVFEHYKVFFPALVLRQSFLISNNDCNSLQKKLGLKDEEIFQPTEQLVQYFVKKYSGHDLELSNLESEMQSIFDRIKERATNIDATLRGSAEAALTRMKYQMHVIEKKMLRAEKRNMVDKIAQLYKLKNVLFPNNSLQERYDTFMPFYLTQGASFFDSLLEATLPYGEQFVILK